MKYAITMLLLTLSLSANAQPGCIIVRIDCTDKSCKLTFDDGTVFAVPLDIAAYFKKGDDICEDAK